MQRMVVAGKNGKARRKRGRWSARKRPVVAFQLGAVVVARGNERRAGAGARAHRDATTCNS